MLHRGISRVFPGTSVPVFFTCMGSAGGLLMAGGIKRCNGSTALPLIGRLAGSSFPSFIIGLYAAALTPLYSGESRTPNTCQNTGHA